MEVTLMRHGEATHNVSARIEGYHAYHDPMHADAALTTTGLSQAARHVLQPADYDAIYCSPLRRCYQTLCAAMPEATCVFLDDRLMEPQGSSICNKRNEMIAAPAGWNRDRISPMNPWFLADEGVSIPSPTFAKRVTEFYGWLRLHHKAGDRILIVSHHDWIYTWFQVHQGSGVSLQNAEMISTVVKVTHAV
jgi:broad specificity phosphatase PhoE